MNTREHARLLVEYIRAGDIRRIKLGSIEISESKAITKIHKDQRVLCICRNGQVRSVCARYLLSNMFGFRKVITCGWGLNDEDTMRELCQWADVVMVVGRAADWKLNTLPEKTISIEVGPDVWGVYNHPVLVSILLPELEKLVST